MEIIQSSTRWRLPILWSLASIILGGVLIVLFNCPMLVVHEPRWRTEDFPLLLWMNATVWPLACILLGIIQYFLIKRYVLRAGWWIMTNVIGMAIGIFVLVMGIEVLVKTGFKPLPTSVLGGASLGAGAGILQWLILKQSFKKALWWVGACTLGGAMGHSFGEITKVDWVGLGSSVIGVGILSGLLLFHWLRQGDLI